MKKKLGLLFTGLIALTCLTGCDNSEETVKTYSGANGGLTALCEHYLGNDSYVRFIRDTYTDNIYMTYFEKHGYGGGGSLSPYYNTNGEIIKYEEFKTVHVH